MSLCCICLDTKGKSGWAVLKNCKHWYHESCISSWIKVKTKCPLCNCVFSSSDIYTIPLEIIQAVREEKEDFRKEKEQIVKEYSKRIQEYSLKKLELEKLVQAEKKLGNNLKIQLNKSISRIEVLNQELEVEKTNRIKAQAYTKHWNFSSDYDYRVWEESWKELESRLEDFEIKDLLKEYHKYFLRVLI